MKKIICTLIALLLCVAPTAATATESAGIYPYDIPVADFWFEEASAEYTDDSTAKSLLLMEYSTGKILFAENEKEHLPIASVTKVMSTLLVMEALDSGKIALNDTVTVSEYAASMGGSQVFLEPGEEMSVEDMLKSLIVASANDATVALAEHIWGSETAFVQAMNQRATELGCENSNFVNTNGLPVENHYSCALDVAIITRELMKHEKVFDYTQIWMDTIRNGSFGLSNTNKLIRFYKGATGMKTGYTDEAKYCLSGTAKRDGLQLIAVVLGADTSDDRFSAAKRMFDFGFANYSIVTPDVPNIEPLKITRGISDCVNLTAEPVDILLEKGSKGEIEPKLFINESMQAPVSQGDEAGYIAYCRNGEELARTRIYITEDVKEVSYGSLLSEIFKILTFKG